MAQSATTQTPVQELLENTWDGRLFCRWLYKAALKFFEDPENQRQFEEWKMEREQREAEGKSCNKAGTDILRR